MSDQNGKLITSGIDGGLDEDGMAALVDTVITGDMSFLAQAIERKGQDLLAALARSGGPIKATIDLIRAEYHAMLEIKLTLMQDEALTALQEVMQGRHTDGTGAMVSAANSVLSRGMFPIRSRQENLSFKIEAGNQLPSLKDVLDNTGDEGERLALADQITDVLERLDGLRGKANDLSQT